MKGRIATSFGSVVQALLFLLLIIVAPAFSFSATRILSWETLKSRLPSVQESPRPMILDGADDANLKDKIGLYMDRNCWDPNAQRVWFALELKEADYVMILVDDDYSNPGKSLPKLQWQDGTVQDGSEILQILEKIQQEFPDGPDLYPKGISLSVDIVRSSIERRFDGIMPRFTVPSSLAPYILRSEEAADDEYIVPRFKYQVCLEEIEEFLEDYGNTPLIGGTPTATAADIFWAPYLERFSAHVPMLHDVNPRSDTYEALEAWYDAMDAIPCYSCRVKGHVGTWQRVLAKTHPEIELASAVSIPNLPKKESFNANKIWATYATGKPDLEDTPPKQVAAFILRNREQLAERASKACSSVTNADDALREICSVLAQIENAFEKKASAVSRLSGDARDVASFLVYSEDGLSIPRDIGAIPFEALNNLVVAAPVPRIA